MIKDYHKNIVYNITFIRESHKINFEWAKSLDAYIVQNPKFDKIKNTNNGEEGTPNWKRALKAFASIFVVIKRIPKDTDILFVEEGLGIFPAYIYKKLWRKKAILLLSGQLPYYLNEPSSGIIYKLRKPLLKMINGFDGILVKSYITYDLIKIPDYKKRVIYSHINNDDLFKIKNNGINLISIGNEGGRKGIDKMLNVFQEVKKENPNLKYYSLGKVTTNRTPEGFIKVGYEKNIKKYLKDSSILMQLSSADAFPLAVLEAMASGVVPIISEKVGTKDIIKNIDEELIVKSEEEAVKKIKSLLNNPEELKRLSKRCREEAEKLRGEKQIKKFQEVFWELVKLK